MLHVRIRELNDFLRRRLHLRVRVQEWHEVKRGLQRLERCSAQRDTGVPPVSEARGPKPLESIAEKTAPLEKTGGTPVSRSLTSCCQNPSKLAIFGNYCLALHWAFADLCVDQSDRLLICLFQVQVDAL